MVWSILKAALLIAVPFGVILSGGWAMERLAGRQYVKSQLARVEEVEARCPLNLRLAGYRVEDVRRHWDALDRQALAIEQVSLRYDLFFPLLYGAALCGALLLGRMLLHWSTSAVWLVLPVAAAVVADWIENGVQLVQMQRYVQAAGSGLEASWIAVASIATTVKWVSLLVASLLLAGMAFSIALGGERQST